MKLVLVDLQIELIKAWRAVLDEYEQVSIHHGSIFDVNCDAVISPGNSFGFMEGGLDLKISQQLGWDVQERLQAVIRSRHHGELPVGCAEIMETEHIRIPYVISAPTMRTPMVLENSVNVYLSLRAALLLVKHGCFESGEPVADKVEVIAVPGMGGGTGQLPWDIIARQMKAAIENVCLDKNTFPKSLHDAQLRHQSLVTAIKENKEAKPENGKEAKAKKGRNSKK